MKILFIKLKNIGDALLVTPALTAARELWPQAQIDVLVRGSTEGILKGSLALTNVYTTAVPEKNKRGFRQFWKDIQLIRRLRKEKYDAIFELSDNDRGRVMAILIGSKNRLSHARNFSFWAKPFFNHLSEFDYSTAHRCEKDVELLRAYCGYKGDTHALQFDRSFADWTWVQNNITTPPIVVHAVSRWKRKMWPLDKWKVLVKRLAEHAPVVLTSGPSSEEVLMARQIAAVNPGKISVTGGVPDWPQMAGLLYSSRMLVTVDTATMHLGAACQIPMVAILGPTDEKNWGPWKCPAEVILPPPAANGQPADRIITSIEVEQVWEKCQKLLAEAKV